MTVFRDTTDIFLPHHAFLVITFAIREKPAIGFFLPGTHLELIRPQIMENLNDIIEELLYPVTATSVDEDYDMNPIIRMLHQTLEHMQTKYPGVYRQVENELRSNFNPDGIHLENLLDEPFANIDPERTVMCSPSTCNVSSCGHLRNLRNLLVKDEISTVPNSDIRDLENPYSWMDPNKFESVKCICKCIANADQDEDFRRDQVPEVPVESIHPQSDPPNQKILQETIRSLEQRYAESEEKIRNLEGIIRRLERTIQDSEGTNKKLEQYSSNPDPVALFQTDVSDMKCTDSEKYSSNSNRPILPATIKEGNNLSGNRSSKRSPISPDILQHKKMKTGETNEAHCSKILIPVKEVSSQSVPSSRKKTIFESSVSGVTQKDQESSQSCSTSNPPKDLQQVFVRLSKPERASLISAVINTVRSVPNWPKRSKEEIMLGKVLQIVTITNPDFPIGIIKHLRWTLNNMIRAHLKKTSSNQKLEDIKLDQSKYIKVLQEIESNLKKQIQ